MLPIAACSNSAWNVVMPVGGQDYPDRMQWLVGLLSASKQHMLRMLMPWACFYLCGFLTVMMLLNIMQLNNNTLQGAAKPPATGWLLLCGE
jgi:ABC-type Fe3+-siderophore transport system permease subunit